MNVDRVFSNHSRLVYVLTSYPDGNPTYFVPNKGNLFDAMKASSALPIVYGAIKVGEHQYIDGALSIYLPIEKAIADGYEEVLVVHNKPPASSNGQSSNLLWLMLPKSIRSLLKTRNDRLQTLEEKFFNDSRVRFIRPQSPLSLTSNLDTNKARLNKAIDLGICDAKEFLGIS